MSHRRALVLGALAASLCLPSTAFGLDEVNSKKLRDAVTVNGILQHERALQAVANANGGTRASGTPGYEASLQYVKQRLVKAGYRVKEQEFTFPFFRELAPATAAQLSPTPKDYTVDTFEYSGSGDVTANVQAVRGITIPPPAVPGTTPAGCTAADFTGFTAGNIALIQRGTCDFGLKARNAKAAGAVGVIIFNEGQEGRTGLPAGTLGEPIDIPVVGMTFADGAAIYQQLQGGATVKLHITTSTEADLDATTKNLIADTKTGNADETVVVGGHLDSVVEGPGINDNGSGTSAILEIAEAMSEQKIKPRRAVRFAFWGAEESGLLGSEHYVTTLPADDLTKIYANLNFDMVGSPNYARFVYDGDGSDSEPAGPPGSGEIESVFTKYFAGQGLASEPTEFSGRSDYGPFIAVGIPAGGLFTGAEGIKTAEQATKYGGTAGVAFDPCYHQACDTINNLSTNALNEMGDAAAHATLVLAKSKSGLFPDGSRKAARDKSKAKKFGSDHAR
ncbi:M28 family metallopeptidase [Solirubrobacter taibaiensis]|nr:M28 family metallopeptidase [Solirubrobacter taibaiensis]